MRESAATRRPVTPDSSSTIVVEAAVIPQAAAVRHRVRDHRWANTGLGPLGDHSYVSDSVTPHGEQKREVVVCRRLRRSQCDSQADALGEQTREEGRQGVSSDLERRIRTGERPCDPSRTSRRNRIAIVEGRHPLVRPESGSR